MSNGSRIIVPTLDANGRIDPAVLPESPPEGWGGGPVVPPLDGTAGLYQSAWFFPGPVAVGTADAQVQTPNFGTVELIGYSVTAGAIGIGTSGATLLRVDVNGTASDSYIGLQSTSKIIARYKGAPLSTFDDVPDLTPRSGGGAVLAVSITEIPTGGTALPRDLVFQLWWKLK